MQFKTEIHAAVPRCHCEACGVKTVSVPWAGKHSSFTLLFEALAIRVILAAANTKKGAGLLGISWNAAHRIMQASVQRGLTRREAEPVAHVGIDEKSFGKGQDYMTIMTGIDRSRVLDVAPERTTAARDSLWKSLTSEQLDSVQAVAMDMWQAFMKNHLDGLLNYRDHRVTNATSKGFNSWIQSIKSAARGFRNFANYRIRILFHCGKLEMTP
jgi:transposase